MRNCIQKSLCIYLLQIGIISAAYYKNGYWNLNKKFDCNERCIPINLLCDGTPHCLDGSDEENCCDCRRSESYHCKNDRCIPIYLECDGFDDCWDGSDEQNCSNQTIPFNNLKYNVPITINQLDAVNHKIENFSKEIKTIGNFIIPMIAFKTNRPEQALDGRTVIFEHMKKVVFYIHGFMTDDLKDGLDMKNALANGTDDVDCVILVDWRRGSYYDHGWKEHWLPRTATDYTFVVTENVPVVSYYLASFINEKIPKHVQVHLIGFSLGGQISGIAARTLTLKTQRTIERISAIDPAGPIFEHSLGLVKIDTTHTLRKTDANFVDVIHGSPYLGMVKEAGDIDFYIDEIDCNSPSCLHRKAFDVYIASITKCSQISCPQSKRKYNKCYVDDATELSSLGYLANLYEGRRKHSIQFFEYGPSQTEKFSTGICSSMFNVELPAKFRICDKPPSVTSDCRLKPYLSLCEEKCDSRTLATATCVKEENKVIWKGRKCLRPISCLNEAGNQVKYFIAYKLPNSFEYLYTFRASDKSTVEWTKGAYPISSIKSALGLTLSPIYEQVDPITFIAWNDDMPFNSKTHLFHNTTDDSDPSTITNGYSKGVLAYSAKGGFLLSHSIPRYPPNPDITSYYEYPESGKRFAQMAVCVTATKRDTSEALENEIKSLLDLMGHFNPQVYASNVLHYWTPEVRYKFNKVIYPENVELREPFIGNSFYGQNFVHIHSFGQSNQPEFKDFFNVLAEHYQTPMVAQSDAQIWLDRYNPLPSICQSKFSVENVKLVKIWTYYGIEWIEWTRTKDHSKWIASKVSEKPIICVGDLNRARATMRRGGMFICFEDEELFMTFSQKVAYQLESCDCNIT